MGQIHRIRFISGHKPGRINTTTSEQKEIIRALLNKDPAKAEEAMRIHLLNTKELLLPSSEMERKFEEFVRNSVPI
jgi:DNA-binding GntR family transcriptional regulator